jgi:hypothetical protein
MGTYIIGPPATAAARIPSAAWTKDRPDALATDTIGPVQIWHNYTGSTVVVDAIYLYPAGELVANDTNYAAWTLYLYSGATQGSFVGTLGTDTVGEGGTGDWTGVEEFEFAGGETSVPAGQSLWIHQDKIASGVITPGYSIRVDFVQPS